MLPILLAPLLTSLASKGMSLSSMEQKLDGKANAADCEAKILRHMERK